MNRTTDIPLAELLKEGCCRGMAEAVDWSGLSEATIRELMRDGKLPWTYEGRCLLLPRHALRLHLEGLFAEPVPKRPRPGVRT